MDDYVFGEVLGLLHELRVHAYVPFPMVAAAQLGLNSLEEVAGHLDTQGRLPF